MTGARVKSDERRNGGAGRPTTDARGRDRRSGEERREDEK
jgi:hypothetical protein